MKKRMLTLALLGLLAGCGSAPTTLHYYSLDADTAPSSVTTAQPQHQLVLRPVALSGQLDRMSLVYQLEGKELHFAEYHRWAGSLDAQLNQLTLNGLSSRLPGWVVRQDGARKACAEHLGRAFPGAARRPRPAQRSLAPADGGGGRVERCSLPAGAGAACRWVWRPGERAGAGLATVARSDCGGCAHAQMRKHKRREAMASRFVWGRRYCCTSETPCTLTSTRRSGARQTISSRLDLLVQLSPVTGDCLPRPSTLTLPAGRPLPIR